MRGRLFGLRVVEFDSDRKDAGLTFAAAAKSGSGSVVRRPLWANTIEKRLFSFALRDLQAALASGCDFRD